MSAQGFRSGLMFPFLILLILAPVSGVGAAGDGIVVYDGEFAPELWSWEITAAGKSYPVLEGTRSLAEPGQPIVPVQELMLLIPVGRQVAAAWVEPLATRMEDRSTVMAVAGPHITDGEVALATARLEPENGRFPGQWGEFTGTHTWRGYNILTLNIFPARVTETADGIGIEYLQDFSIRVSYAIGGGDRLTIQRERMIPGEQEANIEILRQIVHNPQAIANYARFNGVLVEEDKGFYNPTRTPSLSGSPVQYLIITNEEMKSEFQRLADYKTSLGLASLVVTRESISANFRNGADIQETLRMFIQDAYSKWGTEYVLLAGDTDVLPARYVDNHFYPYNSSTLIPVDLYFACLDGTWNANGNAHYGEADNESAGGVGDDVDFAEEVYLGRATVSSSVDAQVFVDKVISYESTPQGSDWTNRILYACEVLFPSDYQDGDNIFLDGAEFSDQMVTELVEPCTDLEYLRMYESNQDYPRDLPLTKAALIDSLNTGHYGTLNQIGHGYFTVMSVGDDLFTTTDADALTNGDHLFMIFSLNCASAAFDMSCLMERFLQNPHGGSIVSIGSSRAAFPYNVNVYQQGFFEALYCTVDNRVGKLIALSRLPYVGNTINNYVDRWTFENYTLLGDPTVPIWTGVPGQMIVTAGSLDLGPNQFAVNIMNGLGGPVENARVCLSREGADISTGFTDGSGSVTLDYLADAPGEVELKISGRDMAQYVSIIDVEAGVTYFSLNSLVVGDNGSSGTTGNRNGIVESGEAVVLVPILVETGGAGTTGLVGTLSTTTEGVTVVTGTVDFIDVSAGGISYPDGTILVKFDAGIADGTPVNFRLALIDDSSATYLVEWTTVVKAPELEAVMLDWEDSTFGNGDGILDIDERVVLSVRFKNFGAGRADLVDLRLRTLNSNVTLYDTIGSFTNLEFMETTGELRSLSLSLSDPTRKSQSTIVITDNYERVLEHDLYVQRPAAPVNFVTDTSQGSSVIALLWDPVEDDNIYGYNILRSDFPTGPFFPVNSDVVVGTSYYRDENLNQLTKYYYQVQALAFPLVPSAVSEVIEESTAPALLSGFPIIFGAETSGHLAVGDVDGDDIPDIILGSDELYVWHHDGTELMDGDNDSQTLGPVTNLHSIFQPAGIVLAQLDDQPGMEMIVSDRGVVSQIYIFRKDGSVLPGWPQTTHIGSGSKWSWATPAVGDIDGDGDLEIVVNTLNGRTWAWHHDGTEVMDGDNDPATNGVFLVRPGATWEYGVGSPCLYDLDGDGAKDIIFPAASDNLGGHRIVALRSDGSAVAGWPYATLDRVNNSPALGDLNNDGVMEIVFYDYGKNLYAVQQNGTDYSGFPVTFNSGAMPGAAPCIALGDLDQDGQLEIIFAGNIAGDSSLLVCVDTDINGGTSGQAMNGWPVELPGSTEGSPVVGDIDGDSIPDILYGIGGGDENAPNNLYAFNASGVAIDGFPITLGAALTPSPVICDIDRDNDVDIVYGGWGRKLYVWDMPFAYEIENSPWPTFHGNMLRDGVYGSSHLTGVQDVNPLPAAAFRMEAPYPNPFNPSASIRLHVPVINGSSNLDLVVYDLKGRKVRTLHQGAISAGWHTLVWDGRDNSGRGQSSGIYFMRASSGGHSSIQKMTLIK